METVKTMETMKHWRHLFVTAAALFPALHLAVYYAWLPERVATHFDGAGRANGWMDRAAFAGFYNALLLLGAGLVFFCCAAMPSENDGADPDQVWFLHVVAIFAGLLAQSIVIKVRPAAPQT